MTSQPPTVPSKTVRNERTKLLAGALNTAATSSFTVGVLAPIAAAVFNVGTGTLTIFALGLGVVGWLGLAIFLHMLARRVLGGLEE